MTEEKLHWLEKLQVQVASVAALALMGFVVWPVLRPADPEHPLSFLADGGAARLGAFALTFWLLAGLGALMTSRGRPSGGAVVAYVGAAGVCLRTDPARALLWTNQQDLHGLYLLLLQEVVILGLVGFVAVAVVSLARLALAKVRPSWAWQAPDLPGPNPVASKWRPAEKLGLLEPGTAPRDRSAVDPPADRRRRKRAGALAAEPGRAVGCLLATAVVAMILLVILMRSADRGQILFAMVLSFLLAMLLAHQLFPTDWQVVAWAAPVLVGGGMYALAAFSLVGGEPGAWIDTPYYARALPIDWICAGGTGSLLGYWLSARKILHHRMSRQPAEAAS